ncbi:hypothetical protein AGMMS50267_10710 [Spirochaetia bacterium]|nr:hypothetical protein AGMMS50267_10710 [Spirochaetia bacterium]
MILYHYTAAENFSKIVTSNELLVSPFVKTLDIIERNFYLKVKRFIKNVPIDAYISFSTENNCALWELYGDNYRGLRISFDLEKLKKNNPGIIIDTGTVTYCTMADIDKQYNKTLLPYIKGSQIDWIDDIKPCLLVKSIHYDFDNEYRFLIDSSKQKFLNINNCITEITTYKQVSS